MIIMAFLGMVFKQKSKMEEGGKAEESETTSQ